MERKLRLSLVNGVFQTSSARSKAMSKVRGRENKTTEIRYRMALVRAGITGWRVQRRGLPGNPDFIFPQSMLAVFVDGCFWHGCSRCGHLPKSHTAFWRTKLEFTCQRDVANSAALRAIGYHVLRFWEHELTENLVDSVMRTNLALQEREGRFSTRSGLMCRVESKTLAP